MSTDKRISIKLAALPRENPMVWPDEEGPQGLFSNDDVDALTLLGTPTMASAPPPRLPADFSPSERLRNWFADLAGLVDAAAAGETVQHRLDVTGFDDDSRQAITEVLGTGEVTAEVLLDGVLWKCTESVMTGIWRSVGDDGSDIVEVDAIPSVVRSAAETLHAAPFPMPENPPNVMSGLAVLAEINERAEAWRTGDPNHVLNFTLLPMSQGDQDLLTTVLGRAHLTLESGGFGSCRIMATTIRRVWAVQYVNAMGKTILDTVEVGDVPEAARAARTDFEDSAQRLGEILRAYLS